jgi:biotin synthase
MDKRISDVAAIVLAGGLLNKDQAAVLLERNGAELYDILYWANRIREKSFGNGVRICSIVPGRLGGCEQDCKFCAQSSRYKTAVPRKAQVLTDEEIMEGARQAKAAGVPHFGIVYSGKAVSESELVRLEKLVQRIRREVGIRVCAGLGIIDDKQAMRLAAAGVERYNHNLETSERHFAEIVTTHTFAERVSTIKAAKKAGMGVCAGGIFGMGETEDDRVGMAMELRELGADTVPMNFLHPIPGTPLGDMKTLEPREILRIIALYRFLLPKASLKVAGGRVLNLRDMQSWIFYAGATSILSGNYLTTAGRAVKDDVQMVKDCGMQPVSDFKL